MNYFATALLAGAVGFWIGRSTFSAPLPPRETHGVANHRVNSIEEKKSNATPAEVVAASPETAPPPSAVTSWDERWKRWNSARHTPRGEREMAEALEQWAQRDPLRAMEAALRETNRTVRAQFRAAVLRGWGSTDVSAAAAWATALPSQDRAEALQEAFKGSAAHPEKITEAAGQLYAKDPSLGSEYGHAAIAALADAGAFEAAAQFAASQPELHNELLGAAYYSWAEHQPEEAVKAMQAIADPAAREEAFRGVLQGWSAADPAAVAEYAATMNPGKERAQAFAEALPRWVNENPAAASAWISEFEPSADFDEGRAAIATAGSVLSQSPNVAAGWAASIVDPELRASTLQAVVTEWIRSNPDAARAFVESDPKLKPNDRAALLQQLRDGTHG